MLLLDHEPHHSGNHVTNAIKDVVQWSITKHECWGSDHFVGFIYVGFLHMLSKANVDRGFVKEREFGPKLSNH